MQSTERENAMKRQKTTATFIFADNTKYIFKSTGYEQDTRESFIDWLKYINYKNDDKLNRIIDAVENDTWIDFDKSFELYLD